MPIMKTSFLTYSGGYLWQQPKKTHQVHRLLKALLHQKTAVKQKKSLLKRQNNH